MLVHIFMLTAIRKCCNFEIVNILNTIYQYYIALYTLLNLVMIYCVIESGQPRVASQVNCQAIEMQLKLIYKVNSPRTICRT